MKDDPEYTGVLQGSRYFPFTSKHKVDSYSLKPSIVVEAIRLVEKKFRGRRVSCAACYLDAVDNDEVSVGVYFRSRRERSAFKKAFRGGLEVISESIFNKSRSEYEDTFNAVADLGHAKECWLGHDKSEQHFSLD